MSDLAYHDPNVKVRNIVIPKRGVPEKTAQIPEVHLYKTEIDLKKNVKKKNGKSRGKKRLERVFFFIIAFLVLILAVELIFHFIISPKLVINKITIEVAGALELSNKEILALAGIGEEEFFFRLDEKIIEERLTQFPLIKTASVEKNFPDTVRIIITGRTPLAMSLVNTEEGMVPVVFDQEGVVFQIGKSVENFDNLVISGIRFHDIKLGMQLPEEIGGLLKDLTALKKDSPFLYEMLSEIRIINRGGGIYEALLFTERHSIPVRIGMSVDERQLKYMFMILDILREDAFAEKIEELDLRSGEIVYRTKEAGDVE
jgi:cell division protein FtsQ